MKIRKNFFILLFTLILFSLFTGCATISGGLEGAPVHSQEEWERKGDVNLSSRGWNWFFKPAREVSEEELTALALEKARDLHGPDTEVVLENRVDSWNPRSLLMLLNSLGWVQDSFITASVWVPRPAPPEQEEPRMTRFIRKDYKVVPAGEYTRTTEFTNVDYRPADSIRTILQMKLDMGEINREEWEERTGKIPDGGRILVQLGRKDLENAITRCFRYSLYQGETRLFQRRGIDDIPYVPGRDKLWWNDVSLDIKQEWESPLTFTIIDTYQEETYEYEIIREEWIEEFEY